MNRPLRIGLSAGFLRPDDTRVTYPKQTLLYLEQAMADYLLAEGVLPILLPQPAAASQLTEMVAQLDGLLLQGGEDVCPESYGESLLDPRWQGDATRDRYEIELVRACIEANRPVLGICRGIQLLNVALGGTLYQDIATQHGQAIVHQGSAPYTAMDHSVFCVPGSPLAAIYGEGGPVKSMHHQAVKQLAPSLVAEAHAEDGLVEAVRLEDSSENPRYLVGVQWHPEFHQPDDGLLDAGLLLRSFLDAARSRVG